MNITTKPQILATLRKNRGMPVDAIAQKLKITKEEYEQYETEAKSVTIEEADKIAKIFKRNWTLFLLDHPPEKPNFDHDNRISGLQRSGIGFKTYDALEEANYLLGFIQSISENQDNKIPSFAEEMPPSALAANFRKAINLPLDKQPKFQYASQALNFWIQALAGIGINVSRFPLGEDDGVRAFSMYKSGRAIIVLNSDDSDNGKLFSLLHELAHILIRNTGVCDLHRDDEIESYCNAFASEALIPQLIFNELIKGKRINNDNALKVADEVAKKLKVSGLAILTKFLKSGFITQPKYDELYKDELAQYQVFKDMKKAKAKGMVHPYALKRSRVGRLFTNEIFDAMHQARISPFEASNYLGFSVGKLGAFNEWVAQHEGT